LAGWWNKVMHAFGFGPEDAEYIEVADEEHVALAAPETVAMDDHADIYGAKGAAARRGTLVSLPGQTRASFKVLVVEPRSFDEVQTICDQLKSRRPVILNLEGLDKDLAQRILNFLNGAVYALGGETQRVSTSIFFFAPPGTDVGTLGRGYTGTAMGGGALDTVEEEHQPVYGSRPQLTRDPLEELFAKHRQTAAAAGQAPVAPTAEPEAGVRSAGTGKGQWENWRR